MGRRKASEVDNQKEKREDLLEHLYQIYRQGEELTVAEYATEKGFSMRETNALVRELKLSGYVEEEKKTGRLILTELGKMEGMDCLERHEKLTQFFQMVSGMEQEEAQEDACRIEHVISQKALEGIDGFLKYGDVYDRSYKGMGMYNVFGEGTFEILLGIYQPERRNPRLLAGEDEKFQSKGILKIEKGISWFVLKAKEDMDPGVIWYRRSTGWVQAKKEENAFYLPTDIFSYMKNVKVPVTEAEALIAITPFEQEPVTIDCREVNIHIW